jgi:YVTN family beta-propeller protein
MTVLNGVLAVPLLVAWLVLITASPPRAAPPGPPVPVPAAQPVARAQPAATLRVGRSPQKIIVSPDGRLAYATTADGLSVIDTATRTVTTTLGFPGRPEGVAFSPDSSRAYVALLGGFVSVFDTRTNAVLATVPVGELPQAIAATPDGRFVYCVNATDGTVSVIDTAGNTVTATVPVAPSPNLAAVSPDGRSLYVYGRDAEALSVIDTATNAVVATIPVGRASSIVFSPDGARVYLLDPGRITVLDPVSRTVVGEATGIDHGLGDMTVTPDGRHLLVAAAGEANALQVVDASTFFVLERVPVAEYPVGVAVTPDATTAFAVGSMTDEVRVIDISAYRG